MIRTIILILITAVEFFATASSASNIYTNDFPINTIEVSALVDKKDVVVIRGDKLWLTHIDGKLPTNIQINGNSWTPTWDDEQESDTYTMKEPRRFLPMNEQRMWFISVSLSQTNATASIIEYPDEFNEWIMMVSLDNSKSDESALMSIAISWKKKDIEFAALPKNTVTYKTPSTKPSPTPVGLR